MKGPVWVALCLRACRHCEGLGAAAQGLPHQSYCFLLLRSTSSIPAGILAPAAGGCGEPHLHPTPAASNALLWTLMTIDGLKPSRECSCATLARRCLGLCHPGKPGPEVGDEWQDTRTWGSGPGSSPSFLSVQHPSPALPLSRPRHSRPGASHGAFQCPYLPAATPIVTGHKALVRGTTYPPPTPKGYVWSLQADVVRAMLGIMVTPRGLFSCAGPLGGYRGQPHLPNLHSRHSHCPHQLVSPGTAHGARGVQVIELLNTSLLWMLVNKPPPFDDTPFAPGS